MSVKEEIKSMVGQSVNAYSQATTGVKDEVKGLVFKEKYQNRIIHCMVGEVDDNYIETPETDEPIVKLEYSKEGLVKMPIIKGKTILVDEEGNETDTPAEGCNLISIGEEEDNKLIILSKNKNLCEGLVHGDILQTTGEFRESVGVVRSNHISVKSNTVYRISETLVASSDWMAIFEYDKDKRLVKYHYNKNMTTSEKTRYIAFKYQNGENINSKYQLEEGHSATPYVPHKQHKSEILLSEPLRKLPNGVCDYIEDSKYVRNTLGLTLNGAENWQSRKLNDGENTYCFDLVAPIRGIQQYSSPNRCNIFTSDGTWQDSEHIWINEWDRITVHISKNRLPSDDVLEFKKWVSENNIDIIYQIPTTIEELPNAITLQGFDDTTMHVENSIAPTVSYGYNALIPYKQEILNQQKQIIYNQNDLDEFISPYLEDIEMQLENL